MEERDRTIYGSIKNIGVAELEYEMPKLPFFFFLPLRLTHFVLELTARYANARASGTLRER